MGIDRVPPGLHGIGDESHDAAAAGRRTGNAERHRRTHGVTAIATPPSSCSSASSRGRSRRQAVGHEERALVAWTAATSTRRHDVAHQELALEPHGVTSSAAIAAAAVLTSPARLGARSRWWRRRRAGARRRPRRPGAWRWRWSATIAAVVSWKALAAIQHDGYAGINPLFVGPHAPRRVGCNGHVPSGYLSG
jgi:hypothetical protein